MTERRNRRTRGGKSVGGNSDPSQAPAKVETKTQLAKRRASTADSVADLENAVLFLENEVMTAFDPREDVETIDEMARYRHDATNALTSSKTDLKSATQRLESALREARARVKMLSDGAVAESELAELSGRCTVLTEQAKACDEAVERAKSDWSNLEVDCRSVEDKEVKADIARERTLPELRTVITLLTAGTNAFFERDVARCQVVDTKIGDVKTVPLGAMPSVEEADALWAAISESCHTEK